MLRVLIKTDTRYPVNRKIVRRAVLDTLLANKITELAAEVSVFVVGSRKMKDLCEKYLTDGEVHDILSFALEEVILENKSAQQGFISAQDGVLRLGDIVLCWPKVLDDARRDDVLVDEELYLLVSHGVEHLLGKHHE